MKHFRILGILFGVVLTLGGCGLFGGSDGTDVSVAENVDPEPTVTNVQPVPAEAAVDAQQPADAAPAAGAALPTAVTLPTAPPAPEPTVDRSQPTTYIVQSGDVLGLIAERFDADIAELRSVNGLDGNLIRVGQELVIPALGGSTETTQAAPAATAAPAAPAPAAASGPVSCNSAATGHCVQPGESLLGIALKYDVGVESLRAANPGVSGDLIRSGEVLNLPGGGGVTSGPVATAVPLADATAIPVAGPASDADCKARNPEFPFFHFADGLCYANPFNGDGSTPVPTAIGGDTDQTCDAGYFLWEDGLCYPIPGVTVTATAGPTATTSSSSGPNYGRVTDTGGCRDGYLPLTTGKCWPEPETTPVEVTPTPTP